MATGIFKGPKGALIFMGGTMLCVMMLVGTEDTGGALVMATEEINRDPPMRDAGQLPPPTPTRPVINRPRQQVFDDTVFANDEELIDDTSGFDPTPDDPTAFDSGPSPSDVTVVESYGYIEQR